MIRLTRKTTMTFVTKERLETYLAQIEKMTQIDLASVMEGKETLETMTYIPGEVYTETTFQLVER